MLAAIIIVVLGIVCLEQYSQKKYYKQQYHDMVRKCNDLADENHHLKVKYGLLPIFTYCCEEE